MKKVTGSYLFIASMVCFFEGCSDEVDRVVIAILFS